MPTRLRAGWSSRRHGSELELAADETKQLGLGGGRLGGLGDLAGGTTWAHQHQPLQLTTESGPLEEPAAEGQRGVPPEAESEQIAPEHSGWRLAPVAQSAMR